MKARASNWSTLATAPGSEVAVSVTDAGGTVCVTLRRRLPSGVYVRMRIIMSAEEARELAYSILPARPRIVPGE